MSKIKCSRLAGLNGKKGFTLIELLIVIAIIAILAAIVFVALNPAARFKDARNSRRWSDISSVMSAVKIDQVDNKGSYLTAIKDNMENNTVYMIGTDTTNCETYTDCAVNATSTDHCVNLAGLVTEGYLGSVPVSPNGVGAWTAGHVGYTLQKEATGILTIRACESEGAAAIEMSR